MYYLVFTGRKWRNAMGQSGITWEPAGVWDAESMEQACLIACQETGTGTAFAVDGFAWGVDTVDAGRVKKLGETVDPITRLERMGERMLEQMVNALPAAKVHELEEGDSDATE
jgi:hypothetical protein